MFYIDCYKMFNNLIKNMIVANQEHEEIKDSKFFSVRNRKLYTNGNGYNYPSYADNKIHFNEEEISKKRPNRKN